MVLGNSLQSGNWTLGESDRLQAWQTLDLGARTEACKLVAELGEPVTPLCPLA